MSSGRPSDPRGGPSRVTLRASAEVKKEPAVLAVRLRVQNDESFPVYVLNRLWMLDAASQFAADPLRVYRFVKGGTLRLLLGTAPLPRARSVFYRNMPCATLVAPAQALEEEILLPLPVAEYSPYFKGEKPSDYKLVSISDVELFVSYLRGGPDIVTQPATFDRTALRIEKPGAWDLARTLRSGPMRAEFKALRRADAFDRFLLPGEKAD